MVLFRRINLPPVLGYLLAGVIVGPFTFAAISLGPFADFQGPVHNLQTIRVLADLGLVLLLFGIGLEIGWHRIRQLGFRVIIIGLVEMSTMFAIGFELAHLLGWSPVERIFLGAALSIKQFGNPYQDAAGYGQSVRYAGPADHRDTAGGRLRCGYLADGPLRRGHLGQRRRWRHRGSGNETGNIAVATLTIGALLVPLLMNYIDRFESDEVLLITSLTLCFGMALAAYQLGLSAAAGAFLVGMILGDTELTERISRIMNPLRDMFAALFFVSLGMLLDVSSIGDYLLPALIISGVFIVGKVMADTIGTLLVGHDGETALQVGTGMPQLGEFSLAMVKTGVEHGTVGAFLSPVVTLATAVTALLYPFIFRSSDMAARFIGRASPGWLRQFCAVTFVWLTHRDAPLFLGGHWLAGLKTRCSALCSIRALSRW